MYLFIMNFSPFMSSMFGSNRLFCVYLLCVCSLGMLLVWLPSCYWFLWISSLCYPCRSSPFLALQALQASFMLSFLIKVWHSLVSLWSIMVRGCEGRPFWSNTGLWYMCLVSIAGSVGLWLDLVDWIPITLLLYPGMWFHCSGLLDRVGVFDHDAALPLLTRFFPLGPNAVLVGLLLWSCIVSPLRVSWLVFGFLLVVMAGFRCVIPALYHYYLLVSVGRAQFGLVCSAGLGLLYFFMSCGLITDAALFLFSCSSCFLLLLIPLLVSFRHKVLNYVCLMSSADHYYLGVWFLASVVHKLICWFGVIRMLAGIHLGLCVAGLSTFRQPQPSMAVPVVYDVDGAFSGVSETDISFCFLPVAWIVLHGHVGFYFNAYAPWIIIHLSWELSMVRGLEDFSLGPQTSPWNSLFCFAIAIAKCVGLPLGIEVVLCCCCSACWAVLQGLNCCWNLLHLWNRPTLVTLFRNSWWLTPLHPWIEFSLQFRYRLLDAAAHLYQKPFFWMLYFHLHHLSLIFVELSPVFFVHHILQWITPFSSLILLFLECNFAVSLWTQLACNNRFCKSFISSWGGMFITVRTIPTHATVWNRVLSTNVPRYGLPFNFFLSSPSMVRGHKAQVLWPVASPLTLLTGPYYRYFVKPMVWITLFLVWYGCHGLVASPLNLLSGQSFSCIVNHMDGTILFLTLCGMATMVSRQILFELLFENFRHFFFL